MWNSMSALFLVGLFTAGAASPVTSFGDSKFSWDHGEAEHTLHDGGAAINKSMADLQRYEALLEKYCADPKAV